MSDGVIVALIALVGVLISPLLLEAFREWRATLKERRRLEAEKKEREEEALATVEALRETVESLKEANTELRTERDFLRDRVTHLERMCFGGIRAQ